MFFNIDIHCHRKSSGTLPLCPGSPVSYLSTPSTCLSEAFEISLDSCVQTHAFHPQVHGVVNPMENDKQLLICQKMFILLPLIYISLNNQTSSWFPRTSVTAKWDESGPECLPVLNVFILPTFL